jgi:hypothetical protein
MRVVISVTDDQGNKFEGTAVLMRVDGRRKKAPSPLRTSSAVVETLNFGTNIRAFMKTYSKGLSGPQKFAVLLARLAKGSASSPIPLSEIDAQWNRMAGLLGGEFNRAYAVRSKENGWVDSPKQGIYILLPGWTDILSAG